MTTHHGYRRQVRSRLPAGLVLPLALAVALAGCGGGSTTGGAAESPAPTAAATGRTVEIVRSGGIAGVRDTVRIARDGSARVTTKDGRGRACRPAEGALTRLRALDLAAVAALPRTDPRIADGFSYAVRIGGRRVSASDGDNDDRRADIVDAAAAVLTSCLAGQSGPVGY